ncbi:MAG: non-hydrolyzing UDP-N-acetylglucosamine 2-epimerase [archaeon]
MKIATIIGARPQFIKMAPLSEELNKHFEEIIIHTGQHYDYEMDDIFFDDLGIPQPDYNLKVGSETPAYQLGDMLKRIEDVLIKEAPDLVIVFGDTNSTLAGAISAVQNHIPLSHIEAGPRNKYIDVPEMMNRLIVDNISPLLFCATKRNYKNLKKEALEHNSYFVGDLMYDIFLENLEKIKKNEKILEKIGVEKGEYHVATCHRAENTDSKQRLKAVVNGFQKSDETIVFSIHPRTKNMLEEFNLMKKVKESKNIIEVEPIGYLDFLSLEYHSKKIITDSGGVQREAYFLKKPCINIYDHTYWPEIEEEGWQVVTGLNDKKIADAIQSFEPKKEQSGIFGEGDAAKKIFDIIRNYDFSNFYKYER